MKRKLYFIFIIALILQLTVRAELRSGHFFKTLQKENLTEQKAVECFDQWFALPQETEWRKVSERTDKLGMTRIEYRQYVSGVEVEHSQVLLHMKDGRVQTANGTVMEAPRMPAKLRRGSAVYKNGTPTDLLGRQLYLVSTKEGYRYATKALSTDGSEWIYTDAETDEVLKRIPTRHSLTAEPVKVTGKSIYSGEVEMDAMHDTESGNYYLHDSQRNIHTLIGSKIPSWEYMVEHHIVKENFPELEKLAPGDEGDMTDEDWDKVFNDNNLVLWDLDTNTLIRKHSIYTSSTSPVFDSYFVKTITFNKLICKDNVGNLTEIVPTEAEPVVLKTEIYYIGTDAPIERVMGEVTSLPFTIDMSKNFVEIPVEGIDILVTRVIKNVDDETGEEYPDYMSAASLKLVPDASCKKVWNTDEMEAMVDYGKGGTWSAVDIHWGMEQTYDFYRNLFDRDSYDDKGAPIYNFLYLPCEDDFGYHYFIETVMDNAAALFASIPPVMVYGMGDGLNKYGMYPVVELSVMAHEFTHLVTGETANLEYLGESGALNESFSDLLGISVKKYVQGSDATWTIGEGVMRNMANLRSMSFPKTSMDGIMPCPDTYQGEFWADTEDERDDYGGVHTNSGVQNKWYYLLTDGDSGTNDHDYSYHVTGIGIDKSQQIAYRTVVEYATQQSQYADIRLASLQAAEDLFGKDSEEVKTVDEAWKAVGVGGQQTAIKEIKNEELRTKNEGAIYDLLGRQIVNGQLSNSKLPQGLYIVGGKKVVINK